MLELHDPMLERLHVERTPRKITGWLVRVLCTLYVRSQSGLPDVLEPGRTTISTLRTYHPSNPQRQSTNSTRHVFFLYGAHSALLPFSTVQDAARTHPHQNDVENCAGQGDDHGVPGSGDACPGCGSDHAWPSRAGCGGKRRYRRGGVGAHFSALRSNKVVWVDCSPR